MKQEKVIICGLVFLKHEKEPYVRSGKSLQGVQEYDSERDMLRCHECGKWYSRLAQHITKRHGLKLTDYRLNHALPSSASLVSLGLASTIRAKARTNLVDPKAHPRVSTREMKPPSMTPEANAKRRATWIAKRNLKARCDEQLKNRILKIATDLGRTPTYAEMAAYSVWIGNEAKARRISARNLMESMGLTPISSGQKVGSVAPKWSREILIEALRDFFVLNGRVPKPSEWNIGILPKPPVYRRYFGSMQAAYEAAGLAKVAEKAA